MLEQDRLERMRQYILCRAFVLLPGGCVPTHVWQEIAEDASTLADAVQ